MNLSRTGLCAGIILFVIIAGLAIPVVSSAEEYNTFISEEYGFEMKYPATWVKAEPKGSYYLVFQAPDLVDKFRPRIHVAAHKPVKDPITVFVQELKTGIADFQRKQQVKLIDEGEFKCDVPGAYYLFLQALDDKFKIWTDIVIVFYKHEQTLVRISCLAPSQSMERFQGMFNDVLTSVRFGSAQKPAQPPARTQAAPPSTGAYQQPAQPAAPAPAAPPTTVRPAPPTPSALPSTPSVKPAPSTPAPSAESEPDTEEPGGVTQPEQPGRQYHQPAPKPTGPKGGPSREPERPATGIVN
jgi:hypothetical protein